MTCLLTLKEGGVCRSASFYTKVAEQLQTICRPEKSDKSAGEASALNLLDV